MADVSQAELEAMLTRLATQAERIDINASRYMQGEQFAQQRAREKGKAEGVAYSIAFLVEYFGLDVPGDWNLIGGRGITVLI